MPDDGYTILSAAAKRAEENGTEQVEEEGRLVEHHQWKIKQVQDAHEAERASLHAKAERLRYELSLVDGAISQIDERIRRAIEHDRMALQSYILEAPQYERNRAGKTFPFAWGPLTLRTKTTPAKAAVVDEAALCERYPAFARPKLSWGDLKKARLQVQDDGTVLDTETGEVLPPDLVEGTAKQSEELAFIKVAGVTYDLTGGMTYGQGDHGDDEDTEPGGADDDWDPWA
jgi:hypothetical protein